MTMARSEPPPHHPVSSEETSPAKKITHAAPEGITSRKSAAAKSTVTDGAHT